MKKIKQPHAIGVHGILFHLFEEGEKTQFRFPVNPQPVPVSKEPPFGLPASFCNANDVNWPTRQGCSIISNNPKGPDNFTEFCPYGQPGDRLFLFRQPARTGDYDDNFAEAKILKVELSKLSLMTDEDFYNEGQVEDTIPECGDHPRLRCYVAAPDDNHACVTPKEAFIRTWNYANRKEHQFDQDPWVWVLTVQRKRERF